MASEIRTTIYLRLEICIHVEPVHCVAALIHLSGISINKLSREKNYLQISKYSKINM